MMAFIGILYWMGIHRLPALTDFWSRDFVLGVPKVAMIMTKNRYVLRSLTVQYAHKSCSYGYILEALSF